MNILVRNLPRDLTEEALRELFQPFGRIESLNIVMDKGNNKSKGFGFVEMPDSKEAKIAIKQLNGQLIDGMKIRVKITIRKR